MNLQFIYVLLFTITLQLSISSSTKAQSIITPETALENYVNKIDTTFKWEIKDSYQTGDLTVYTILLNSQRWRAFDWTHQLSVLVPNVTKHNGALLFISGGSV